MTAKSCKHCGTVLLMCDYSSTECSDCRKEAKNAGVACGKCNVVFTAKNMSTVTVRAQSASSASHRTHKVRYCSECFTKVEAGLSKQSSSQEKVIADAVKARADRVKQVRRDKRKSKAESEGVPPVQPDMPRRRHTESASTSNGDDELGACDRRQ
jgi:hypothetical protein